MATTQALQDAVEGYLRHLRAPAQRLDVPIEAPLWTHLTAADLVELTVVSCGRAYIFALPVAEVTHSDFAAHYQEVLRPFLAAIKNNLPLSSRHIKLMS